MRRKNKKGFKGEVVSPETLAAEGVVVTQELEKLAEKLFIRYGSYVLTNRAIPDMRDGLKPVQRRILWALRGLKIHHNTPTRKSARVVGEVIGKYSPHGDMPTYEALVNMTQPYIPHPLVFGQGNWGSFTDPPASSRYTECRLNQLADDLLLDPDYLAVTKLWPNFDGQEEEPMVLPAKVPVVLLNGAVGIASGTSTAIPSFSFKGVVKLSALALQGKEITPRLCLKYLQFNYVNGAVCVSEDKDLLGFFKTGIGSVLFACNYEIDEKEKQIVLTSLTPWFNLVKTTEKLLNFDGIDSVVNISSGEEIRIAIRCKRNVATTALKNLAKEIEELLTQSMSYRLNLTVRSASQIEDKHTGKVMMADEEANFKAYTFAELFAEWAKWRTQLEKDVLNYRKQRLEEKIAYNNLLRLAISKLDIIFQLLKRKNIDIDTELSKKLKITLEEAQRILSLPVRRLSSLSDTTLNQEIIEYKKGVKQLNTDLKAPNLKAANDLTALLASKPYAQLA